MVAPEDDGERTDGEKPADENPVDPIKPEIVSGPPTGEFRIHSDQFDDEGFYQNDDEWRAPGTDGGAMIALGFAVASFIVLPIIGAIVALIMAPGAKRRIRQSNGHLKGAGFARAAQFLAIVNFFVVAAVVWLLFAVFGWILGGLQDVLDSYPGVGSSIADELDKNLPSPTLPDVPDLPSVNPPDDGTTFP